VNGLPTSIVEAWNRAARAMWAEDSVATPVPSRGGRVSVRNLAIALAVLAVSCAAPAAADEFVASWAASAHGPYPVGNPTAQPELRFAFPSPERGARDQSFRMIVRPDVWGREARIRLSNAFGTRPVTFDGAFVGLQESGSAIVPGTNTAATFGGNAGVVVPPGGSVVSDPVRLGFVGSPEDPLLKGRKLAVSFHVAGESGPVTWHAKALTSSYLSAPDAGPLGGDEGEGAFPFSTTSWYFLDELEMSAPAGTRVLVAFGDSITDGTASTLNGDDRWPDVLARRLHAAFGDRFVVVNEGIGGNQVAGPAAYAPATPFAGGPSAVSRIERDIVSLPGVGGVIWLEGINDLGTGNAPVETVVAAYEEGVARLRERLPGVKVYAGTLTSSLNSTNAAYAGKEVDAKRRALNEFFRSAGIFDGVIDFDGATLDGATGELKAEYQPNSTTGGPGDKLHPNRAGYWAMGNAVDLNLVTGGGR
jgi:lysophospholipase L1-like esterase